MKLAITIAVVAQLVGLQAYMSVLAATHVHFESPTASCHYVEKPSAVPLAGIESREYEQGWSWFPPGLTCRTVVQGREVIVREPTWRPMAGPLAALTASVVVTSVALGWAPRILLRRRSAVGRLAIAMLTVISQPLVLITLLAALVVPGAI